MLPIKVARVLVQQLHKYNIRSDIDFAACKLLRYTRNPKFKQWLLESYSSWLF